jgi:hypothetical protein
MQRRARGEELQPRQARPRLLPRAQHRVSPKQAAGGPILYGGACGEELLPEDEGG